MPDRPDPADLASMLGQRERLRAWARTQGFELEAVPADVELLDEAFAEAIPLARGELGGQLRLAALASQAGLFLGTVIVSTIPGTRWRLWLNGHPVIRLPSGRDLDVVALADDRVSNGTPLLADIYASAAANPPH